MAAELLAFLQDPEVSKAEALQRLREMRRQHVGNGSSFTKRKKARLLMLGSGSSSSSSSRSSEMEPAAAIAEEDFFESTLSELDSKIEELEISLLHESAGGSMRNGGVQEIEGKESKGRSPSGEEKDKNKVAVEPGEQQPEQEPVVCPLCMCTVAAKDRDLTSCGCIYHARCSSFWFEDANSTCCNINCRRHRFADKAQNSEVGAAEGPAESSDKRQKTEAPLALPAAAPDNRRKGMDDGGSSPHHHLCAKARDSQVRGPNPGGATLALPAPDEVDTNPMKMKMMLDRWPKLWEEQGGEEVNAMERLLSALSEHMFKDLSALYEKRLYPCGRHPAPTKP